MPDPWLLPLPVGLALDDQFVGVRALSEGLKRSLIWDRGTELVRHAEITLAICFADPHSPWQCGGNENTNGLLCRYFPTGADLAAHTGEDLAAVAAQLNDRPL